MRQRILLGALLACTMVFTMTPGLAMTPREPQQPRAARGFEISRVQSSGEHAVPLRRNLSPLSAAVATESYTDALLEPDPGQAWDLTTVLVSDNGSTIQFELEIPNLTTIRPEDELVAWLDTVMNPGVGSGSQMGADYFVVIGTPPGESPVIFLARWNGFAWEAVTSGVAGSFGVGVLEFFVPTSDLGGATQFNFYLETSFFGASEVDKDFAPAIPGEIPPSATWRYPDDTSPVATALRSSPRGSSRTQVTYRVTDNSGYTTNVIEFIRQGKSNPTDRVPFGYDHTTTSGDTYGYIWTIPKNIKGYHNFCVRATDGAGNRNSKSCNPVRFKRISTDAKPTVARVGSRQTLIKLELEKLPKGTRVKINCVKGCPYKENVKTSGKFTSKVFKNKPIQNAVVAVRVSKARYVGYYEKIVFGGNIKSTDKCLPPGLSKPSKCP